MSGRLIAIWIGLILASWAIIALIVLALVNIAEQIAGGF